MTPNKKKGWITFCVLGIALVMMACGLSSKPDSEPAQAATPTPTPTVIPGGSVTNTPESNSRCEGLSGVFELQLLVGPADAVGLDPVAIGNIPFSVVSNKEPYAIEGANTISYEDVLAKEWGTYTVTFNMDVTISGDCGGEEGTEQLTIVVEMSGDQMIEVVAEGFQGEYPWSGTHRNELTLPLQEGATAGGEGWQIVLHINQ